MNILKLISKKDKKLGVDDNSGRYDLPLNNAEGFHFLIILISLMTFLGMMALCGSFILNAMTDRWVSGLENKLTIEIPAESEQNNKLRSPQELQELSLQAQNMINRLDVAKSSKILTRQDIADLVSPWLGDDISDKTIPLPALISIELKESATNQTPKLEKELKTLSNNIVLDSHESWLIDVLHFIQGLQFATTIVGLIIAITTVIAISGSVSARMAVHQKEIELLHLMGASNSYIARQFQRHAMFLTFKGGLIGSVIGTLILVIIHFIIGDSAASLLPEFHFQIIHFFILLCLPFIVCLIGITTARYTVLHALARMP